MRLGQIERLRILQCGKARRRGADSFDDQASLVAQFAQSFAETIDLRAVLPGIEFGERVLQPVVVFAKSAGGLLQLRRQVGVEYEVPLGEHHEKSTSARSLQNAERAGRLPERHEHVDVLEVDGATLAGIGGADLVGAAETQALRFDCVQGRREA